MIFALLLYFQDALRSLMVAVKSSNELPNTGEDFNYYSSFSAYQEIMNVEGKRMLEMWDYYFWFFHILDRGKKITCPGVRDKLNFRQDKHIFPPNVQRTSKKLNASIFSLTRTSYLVTGQVKSLMHLPRGQVKIFRIFYPCLNMNYTYLLKYL